MIITVRCFFIPVDITFDTNDVVEEFYPRHYSDSIVLMFKSDSPFFASVCVDKQHYLDEKMKNNV